MPNTLRKKAENRAQKPHLIRREIDKMRRIGLRLDQPLQPPLVGRLKVRVRDGGHHPRKGEGRVVKHAVALDEVEQRANQVLAMGGWVDRDGWGWDGK